LQDKIAAKWKRKIRNRSGILDTGCTLGAGAEHNADCFHDTGLPSEKVFMLPDKTRISASKNMRIKHNLQHKASKMKIVPNLHSTLISVPKMADVDYITVFDKKRPEYMTLQLPLYQHQKTPSSLHHAARVLDCENLTWTMKS
jgi:hypothetical protein